MPQGKVKRKQKPWRELEPEEWLQRYSDWRKCQPGSPKRQAYHLIQRLARLQRVLGPWTVRIASRPPRKIAAAKVRQRTAPVKALRAAHTIEAAPPPSEQGRIPTGEPGTMVDGAEVEQARKAIGLG